jgi:hypothetical protein
MDFEASAKKNKKTLLKKKGFSGGCSIHNNGRGYS